MTLKEAQEWADLWIRSKGICECGCGRMMRVTEDIYPAKAEKHHVRPLGMGGSKHHYELYEYRMLRLECHQKEHAAGCPHRVSWIQEMKDKEGL